MQLDTIVHSLHLLVLDCGLREFEGGIYLPGVLGSFGQVGYVFLSSVYEV